MYGRTNRRMEFPPCVLQDIVPYRVRCPKPIAAITRSWIDSGTVPNVTAFRKKSRGKSAWQRHFHWKLSSFRKFRKNLSIFLQYQNLRSTSNEQFLKTGNNFDLPVDSFQRSWRGEARWGIIGSWWNMETSDKMAVGIGWFLSNTRAKKEKIGKKKKKNDRN